MKAPSRFVMTILLVLLTIMADAQKNKDVKQSSSGGGNSIGLRAGGPFGITYKHFFRSNTAFELIVGGGHPGLGVTGLYELHKPLRGAANFYWMYGIGGHVGVYSSRYHYGYSRKGAHYYADGGSSIGVDFILGIEYRAKEIPFTFGIDIKPYVDLIPGDTGIDPGFNIRFCF